MQTWYSQRPTAPAGDKLTTRVLSTKSDVIGRLHGCVAHGGVGGRRAPARIADRPQMMEPDAAQLALSAVRHTCLDRSSFSSRPPPLVAAADVDRST